MKSDAVGFFVSTVNLPISFELQEIFSLLQVNTLGMCN